MELGSITPPPGLHLDWARALMNVHTHWTTSRLNQDPNECVYPLVLDYTQTEPGPQWLCLSTGLLLYWDRAPINVLPTGLQTDWARAPKEGTAVEAA